MRSSRCFSALLAAGLAAGAFAPAAAASLPAALRDDLAQYLRVRGTAEHISAASLSVSLAADKPTLDVAAGTTTYGGSVPATPDSLFQIGSNTKAFTAATLLELEAAGVLDIRDPVGKWLPEYPAWKDVTIRQLLDMTNGIPTYDDSNAMLETYANDPTGFISTEEIVGFVYPRVKFAPGHGWFYSNTAYILSQMIVEKATGRDYAVEIASRFFDGGPKLPDTYYSADIYPSPIQARMVAGYFFNRDPDNGPLEKLFGRDMRPYSLSWAQGAGGIVSTPHALTQWVRALYESPMLAPAQRRELESIVSMKNGAPIASTSTRNPRAFGLGVAQVTSPNLPRFWFYEGETMGYRMVYVYFPKNRTTFAIGLNSQPDSSQDGVGSLITAVYQTLKGFADE